MAITISGENNNDKILASDGVIDQISGINIVGVITATTFTGNLIGNVTGNLTGNVNSTSPLLLQTGGSERFRITGNNELGIAGANYGSAGQVLTSGGSGSAVTWSSIPSQVSIANNADNRVITGGSGINLSAESSFTYNAGSLIVSNASGNVTQQLNATSGDAKIVLDNSGNGNYSGIDFERERSSGAGVNGGSIFMKSDTSTNDAYLYIQAQSASAQAPITSALSPDNGVRILLRGGDGILSFETGDSERLRIASGGNVGIGTDNPTKLLELFGTDPTIKLMDSSGDAYALIEGDFADQGSIRFRADPLSAGSDTHIRFDTDGDERLRIKSDGKIGIGHHIANQINFELTIRPANDGGILLGRPGDTVAPINKALTITTTTTGSEAYHTKYHTYNCNSIFATYEGGGTGGNFIFKTAVGSGNETEKLRITSGGTVNIGGDYTSTTSILRINSTSYPETTEYLAVFKAGVANGNRFKNRYIKIRNNFTGSAHGGVPIVWEANADGSNNKAYGAIVTESDGDIRFLNAAATSEKAIGTDLLSTISEKLRINTSGELHISDRNSSNTGDHFFQAGAFGIRMEDTGGYNRWNIERNYGGFQSTPLVHLSAQGRVGINQGNPSKATLHVVGPSSSTTEIVAKFKGASGNDARTKIGLAAAYSDTANDTEGQAYVGALRNGNGNSSQLFFEVSNGSTLKELARVDNNGINVGGSYRFNNGARDSATLPNTHNIGDVTSNTISYQHNAGLYYVYATIPTNDTWYTMMTSFNDSACNFRGVCGDASSKNSFYWYFNPTSPGYGVNPYGEKWHHGAWNTGSVTFRLDGSHPNWNLQIKCTSYYGTNRTASLRGVMEVYY